MHYSNLQTRIYTAIRQCKTLLESHYREYQVFHDGCSCGLDCDEGGSIDDYNIELCFKLEEANLASMSMHDWFDDEGRFKNNEVQHELAELFSYCVIYAEKHSPILEITLNSLVKEMERMDLEQAQKCKPINSVVVALDLWDSDRRNSKH